MTMDQEYIDWVGLGIAVRGKSAVARVAMAFALAW
jgi:hypothetical protein